MMRASLSPLHCWNSLFSLSTSYYLLPLSIKTAQDPRPFSSTSLSLSKPLLLCKCFPNSSDFDSDSLSLDDDVGNDSEIDSLLPSYDSESGTVTGNGVEVEKTGNNRRRIRSRIGIDASLETVWRLLTDYERLSDFLPGLAVSRLLEKKENFAKLFQVGQQNLAFGLKFNAKGVVDCYEKELVHLASGQSRDIEFKMIEGDFKTFEGKWSIVQTEDGKCEGQEFQCILSYMVDVEPKMWLPVRLVEGRLCKEIEVNLNCIREEAQRVVLEAS